MTFGNSATSFVSEPPLGYEQIEDGYNSWGNAHWGSGSRPSSMEYDSQADGYEQIEGESDDLLPPRRRRSTCDGRAQISNGYEVYHVSGSLDGDGGHQFIPQTGALDPDHHREYVETNFTRDSNGYVRYQPWLNPSCSPTQHQLTVDVYPEMTEENERRQQQYEE